MALLKKVMSHFSEMLRWKLGFEVCEVINRIRTQRDQGPSPARGPLEIRSRMEKDKVAKNRA
jgi:hypothetical protein